MALSLRIRKIRTLLGLEQSFVAGKLAISQQAYHTFETNADKANIKTLRKLCEVLQINIAFLFSEDIPITEESLAKFKNTGFAEIVSQFEKRIVRLELKIELSEKRLK